MVKNIQFSYRTGHLTQDDVKDDPLLLSIPRCADTLSAVSENVV